MSRKLIVDDGRRERELLLVGTIVVGRDPMCDISEADSLLSRRHAEFLVNGTAVTVRDLGSRNGIFVNGVKVAQETLQSGDKVQIGHLQLRYVEDSAPLSVAPEGADPEQTALLQPIAHVAMPAQPVAPPPAPATAPPSPPAAPPLSPALEEEETRVVSRPVRFDAAQPAGANTTAPLPSPPATPKAPDDSERTRVVASPVKAATLKPRPAPPVEIPAPRIVEPAVVVRSETTAAIHAKAAPSVQESAATLPGTSSAAPGASGSWTAFVYTQLGLLAIVIVLSMLVPLWNGWTSSAALAGSLVVTAIATGAVGTLISRRAAAAFAALKQNVDLAAAGRIQEVPDPLGAASAKDLADTITRLMRQLHLASAREQSSPASTTGRSAGAKS